MTAIALTICKLLAIDRRAEALDYLAAKGGHAAAAALIAAGHDYYALILLEDMKPTNAAVTGRVLNKHHGAPPVGSIYIGRPSKWGNPFTIGKDGTRAEVISKHRAWVCDQPHLMAALHEIRGRDLVCFCAPAACHGDTLLQIANDTLPPPAGWADGANA